MTQSMTHHGDKERSQRLAGSNRRYYAYLLMASLVSIVAVACAGGNDDKKSSIDNMEVVPTPTVNPMFFRFALIYFDEVSIQAVRVRDLLEEQAIPEDQRTQELFDSWITARLDATRELADATERMSGRLLPLISTSDSCNSLRDAVENARQSTSDISATWARFVRFEPGSGDELWPKTKDAWAIFTNALFELETAVLNCEDLDLPAFDPPLP